MRQSIEILRTALRPHYDTREVQSIVELVIEEVTGMGRVARIMHGDAPLPVDQQERIAAIAEQLDNGIPVQYALGYETFCGRRFLVNPAVLIPRPETAELVHWIEEDHADIPAFSCLDIGTGSGCIALTLAADCPESQVTAVDVSEGALNTAAGNAKALGIDNIRFVRMDILKEVGEIERGERDDAEHGDSLYPVCGDQIHDLFDIIVSNPPYIPYEESAEMLPVVLDHEPSIALFVPNDDPLRFYKAIAKYGLTHLNPGGSLYFEINERFGQETIAVLKALGYEEVECRRDGNGKERMAKGRKKKKKPHPASPRGGDLYI